MEKSNELGIIKELIEGVHSTAIWYIKLLKDTDPYKRFELNGRELNSLYWMVGHLAWAEDMLLIRSTGEKGFLEEYPWLKNFELGASHSTEGPSFEDLKEVAKEIHVEAMRLVSEMPLETLDKENSLGFKLFGYSTVRGTYYHQIRHVGSHIGQLGWLCKLNGIQAV